MVVTVAPSTRRMNNLYKESEKTGGEKPIDLIKATRPDHHRGMNRKSRTAAWKAVAREALDAMNPPGNTFAPFRHPRGSTTWCSAWMPWMRMSANWSRD